MLCCPSTVRMKQQIVSLKLSYISEHTASHLKLYLSCEADDLSVVKHVYLLLFVSAGSACRQSQ